MKKIVSLVFALAFLLTGCSSVANPTPTVSPSTVQIDDLIFTLPKGWTVKNSMPESVENKSTWQTVNIKVPDPKYDVSIPVKVVKNQLGAKADGYPLLTTTPSGAKVYQDACAPVIACYIVDYSGNFYNVSFGEPDSNEPVPENLDGVWFPSTTVTEADALNAVSNLEVVKPNSSLDDGLYKNKLYGFSIKVPVGAKLSGDQAVESAANFVPVYSVAFYSGGSLNSSVDVYSKDAAEGLRKDLYHKVELVNGQEVWQKGPSVGSGGYWFLDTIIFGEKNVFTIDTNNDKNNADFKRVHQEIVDGFKFEK